MFAAGFVGACLLGCCDGRGMEDGWEMERERLARNGGVVIVQRDAWSGGAGGGVE